MQERLIKYLFGKLSETEKQELLNELEINEKLKKQFVELNHTLSLANMLNQPEDKATTEKKLSEFKKRTKKIILRRTIISFSKYAAIILFLISISTGIFFYMHDQKMITEYTAPIGKRLEIILPDGTTAWLAPSSKIKIDKNFKGKQRTVTLEGEGLFDVIPNKNKPFIVQTENYNIEVLGTTFNIENYPDKNIFRTSLITGSVLVYNEIDKIELTPGESIRLIDGTLKKDTIDTHEIFYMQSGIYSIENKTFPEVFERLGIWYNIEFELQNQELFEYHLTGRIRENDNIETILDAIKKIYPFESIRTSDNKIRIN